MRGRHFAQGSALRLRATAFLPGTAGRKTRPGGMSVALSGAPGEACAETTLPGGVRQGGWKVSVGLRGTQKAAELWKTMERAWRWR